MEKETHNCTRTTSSGIPIEGLNSKQYFQLLSLCEEFQPYGCCEDIVFTKVIFAARGFCDSSFFPFRGGRDGDNRARFNSFIDKELMNDIKRKYYFNGVKYANKTLTSTQYNVFRRLANAPKIRMPFYGIYFEHDSAEKELFMKVVRACRDYMRGKMSEEAQEKLFERLCVVHDAMS